MAYRVLLTATQENVDAVIQSGCDGVVIDLADASADLQAQRSWSHTAFPKLKAAGQRIIARVNHPSTMLLREDLEAVVHPGLDAVMLPHVTETQDVRELTVALREFELSRGIEPGDVALFPVIDTARGLQRAGELAGVAPRVGGLVFDAESYSSAVGARAEESGPRLSYARGACIAAARAVDGLPLVTGDGTDCRTLAQYGFAGILLGSQSQVRAAVAAFVPGTSEIDKARDVVAAYESARANGARVARVGRVVVDSAAARRARQVLDGSSAGEGS